MRTTGARGDMPRPPPPTTRTCRLWSPREGSRVWGAGMLREQTGSRSLTPQRFRSLVSLPLHTYLNGKNRLHQDERYLPKHCCLLCRVQPRYAACLRVAASLPLHTHLEVAKRYQKTQLKYQSTSPMPSPMKVHRTLWICSLITLPHKHVSVAHVLGESSHKRT